MVPVIHPHTDKPVLPILGKVFSHGYLVSGFFPAGVAFLIFARVLLDPNIAVPNNVLTETFADSLCSYEAEIVENALKVSLDDSNFHPQMNVLGLLSRYGCREVPLPKNLRRILNLASIVS